MINYLDLLTGEAGMNLHSEEASNFSQKFRDAKAALGKELDKFLRGEIFNGDYSESEQKEIVRDLVKLIRQKNYMELEPLAKPRYIATAGAPGTGKTYHLENYNEIKDSVYVEPDQNALKALSGYQRDIKTKGSKYAYEKWRDASNFIANFLQVFAVSRKLNIVHGTTSQSPRIINDYKGLKESGYKITIDVFFADINDSNQAINQRDKFFVQVSEEDKVAKVAPIFSRLFDAYLPFADTLILYRQPPEFYLGNGNLVALAIKKGETLEFGMQESRDWFCSQMQLSQVALNKEDPNTYANLEKMFLAVARLSNSWEEISGFEGQTVAFDLSLAQQNSLGQENQQKTNGKKTALKV